MPFRRKERAGLCAGFLSFGGGRSEGKTWRKGNIRWPLLAAAAIEEDGI